jgi:hypothetical protein
VRTLAAEAGRSTVTTGAKPTLPIARARTTPSVREGAPSVVTRQG